MKLKISDSFNALFNNITMFWKKVATIFMLLVVLSGCGQRVAIYSERQNGKSIGVKNGDIFKVRLKANPTAGYFWSVNIQDEKIVTQDQNYQYESDSNLIGAGGKVVFSFRALLPGKDELTLRYLRPFEDNVAPLKTYKLSIISK